MKKNQILFGLFGLLLAMQCRNHPAGLAMREQSSNPLSQRTSWTQPVGTSKLQKGRPSMWKKVLFCLVITPLATAEHLFDGTSMSAYKCPQDPIIGDQIEVSDWVQGEGNTNFVLGHKNQEIFWSDMSNSSKVARFTSLKTTNSPMTIMPRGTGVGTNNAVVYWGELAGITNLMQQYMIQAHNGQSVPQGFQNTLYPEMDAFYQDQGPGAKDISFTQVDTQNNRLALHISRFTLGQNQIQSDARHDYPSLVDGHYRVLDHAFVGPVLVLLVEENLHSGTVFMESTLKTLAYDASQNFQVIGPQHGMIIHQTGPALDPTGRPFNAIGKGILYPDGQQGSYVLFGDHSAPNGRLMRAHFTLSGVVNNATSILDGIAPTHFFRGTDTLVCNDQQPNHCAILDAHQEPLGTFFSYDTPVARGRDVVMKNEMSLITATGLRYGIRVVPLGTTVPSCMAAARAGNFPGSQSTEADFAWIGAIVAGGVAICASGFCILVVCKHKAMVTESRLSENNTHIAYQDAVKALATSCTAPMKEPCTKCCACCACCGGTIYDVLGVACKEVYHACQGACEKKKTNQEMKSLELTTANE